MDDRYKFGQISSIGNQISNAEFLTSLPPDKVTQSM